MAKAEAPAGTVFRIPIKVSAFIEIGCNKQGDDLDVEVVVDRFDYDYAPWPRVSAFGDDELVIQMDTGGAPENRHLGGDADYVSEIRAMAERRLDADTKWRISKTVDKDITEGTHGA